MKDMISMSSDRFLYMDYLRVFSIFAMIIIHVSTFNFYVTNVNGFDWQVFNFFNSISRWCVPVFVMISGALFLDKVDIPLHRLYSKYILRMIIAFLTWGIIYCFTIDYHMHVGFINTLSEVFHGHFHMWFILMIIGLYMCYPFIKSISIEKGRTRYYLYLSFIFAFFIPSLVVLTQDFKTTNLFVNIISAINENANTMNMHLVLGYTGYFILGNYLNKTDIKKRDRKIIYVFGLIGFILTIFLNALVAIKTQQAYEKYGGYFNLCVLLQSIAVFTWFKYKTHSNKKLDQLMLKLSKYSFGAYLIHVLIIVQLYKLFNLTSLSFNPLLSILTISMIVFVISFLLSGILHKVPLIKKYCV